MSAPTLLTLPQAVRLVHAGERILRAWVTRGHVPAHRSGWRLLVDRAELDAHVLRRGAQEGHHPE